MINFFIYFLYVLKWCENPFYDDQVFLEIGRLNNTRNNTTNLGIKLNNLP